MCEIILKYYKDKKDIMSVLSMIVKRAGHIKFEDGILKVRLRRFKNQKINDVAQNLCKDLNEMKPKTLDNFKFPIYYEIL